MPKPTVKTVFNTVANSTTVSKLVRENAYRKELIVTNTSTAILYVAFGSLPSSTNYAVALPANGGAFFTDSTDAVNGVWASSASGAANIAERF